MSFSLKPSFAQIPNVKVSYNVGCLFDIPTGVYVRGVHGEHILNGGVGSITGVVGIGNQFKSTIMHFMMLQILSRFPEAVGSTYDTEINIMKSRLASLGIWLPDFKGEDVIFGSGRWVITDKTKYFANEWYEVWKKDTQTKVDNAKYVTRITPFLEADNKTLMTLLVPTPAEIDSFTEFETADVASMQAANELGDSGANTMFMRQGISKTRFLTDVPKLIASGNSPMFLSAHIGKEIPMDARAAPVKKLQFLKNGDKIKGGTDKFTFLTTNCFQCQNATPLINDGTKGPEYPRDSDDNLKFDTDLFVVTLVCLRSKTGPSGMMMQIIVSQQQGVLPSLSEFHYIKTVDRFGLGGNVQNYFLDLLPDVKLSRTAVRGKIDNNPRLRRALNITAEMCQMTHLWHDKETEDLICTPLELYNDLKAKGYDWDQLLDTRGWWTFNNDEPVERVDGAQQYFLSTYDLLRMRKSLYHPWWMPKPAGLVLIEEAPKVEGGMLVVDSLDDVPEAGIGRDGRAMSTKVIVKRKS